MDLLDALCSNQSARTTVELSLSPHFRRSYSAQFKAIAAFDMDDTELAQLAAPYLPEPQARGFWLLATDVTPQPRPYSRVLADRSCVYQPTVIRGNKPLTIGHQYSTVALLPEKATASGPAWAITLSVRRVPSSEDQEVLGDQQLRSLLNDPAMPFHGQLCVSVRDSSYSKPACLATEREFENLVSLTRVRSNRVFYQQYVPAPDAPPRRGHPRWYGERFALREPETWGIPDEQATCQATNQRGEPRRVEIKAWHNLLMRGKRKPTALPMHRYPFTLVRVQVYREDGMPLYQQALWFLVMGQRRTDIPVTDAYQAYTQRFDIEHTYRFCKQRLLLCKYQTPDVDHEQRWWRLVHLAYLQLWIARDVAQRLPRPWERSSPSMHATTPLTPSLVQRDFSRIIQELGTPAAPSKPRGYSPGRTRGASLSRRERLPVVKKQVAVALPD